MRSIPIDTHRAGIFKGISAEPKHHQGTQSVNADNIPVWKIQALVTPPEGKATLEEINIASPTEPNFPPLSELEFENLTARHWEMNGRSGVSLSATSFEIYGG